MIFSFSHLTNLLKREPHINKNDCGHVLIIGSDYFLGGAVIMAAQAASRCGPGKITVITRKEHFSALLSRVPNVMTADLSMNDIFAAKDVIVIGPGLGKSEWAKDLLTKALNSDLPKVIDADALNLISEFEKNPNLENCIITPHAGEAARLLKSNSKKIDEDREESIKKLRKEFAATCVLKGSGSLILGKSGKIHQCQFGNSGMSSAGMGDVLSGVLGALLAQGLNLEDAAVLGVNLHSFAADLVKENQGEIGMMATDLIKYFPLIINNKI